MKWTRYSGKSEARRSPSLAVALGVAAALLQCASAEAGAEPTPPNHLELLPELSVPVSIPAGKAGGERWRRVIPEGGVLYLPAMSGLWRVAEAAKPSTPEHIVWTSPTGSHDCTGEPFTVTTMTAFRNGRSYLFNGVAGQLQEYSARGLGTLLDGSMLCQDVAWLDDKTLVCGSPYSANGARKFAVNVRGLDMSAEASMYPTAAFDPIMLEAIFVGTTNDLVAVTHTAASEITVFDRQGKQVRVIPLAEPGFHAARPLPGVTRSSALKDDFHKWFTSFTPVLCLAAGGGLVGVSYRIDPTHVHSVIARISDGAVVAERDGDNEVLEWLSASRAWLSNRVDHVRIFKLGGAESSGHPAVAGTKGAPHG